LYLERTKLQFALVQKKKVAIANFEELKHIFNLISMDAEVGQMR
jgi:hypothetical protein